MYYTWITWIQWLVWVFLTKEVLCGCGNKNGRSKKREKSTACWYELWYFWVIVALFVAGATVIVFFYCKQQAKNARRLQNAGRNRYPQMFLPPPPPSYETPGHQPPPYHIAISVHFQEVQVYNDGGRRGIERQHQQRDGDAFMEVEEVSDNYPPRAESVPPPYTLAEETNSNAEDSPHENSVSAMNGLDNGSNNNFLIQSSSTISQPPAYSQQTPTNRLSQENIVVQDVVREGNTQPSSLSSSTPPSATTPPIYSSALSASDLRLQSGAIGRGVTIVCHGVSSNQSVLNESGSTIHALSRRASGGHVEHNSTEDNAQRPVMNSSIISTSSRVTPVSRYNSLIEEEYPTNVGRLNGSLNQRHTNKRPSLGAIRYANNLTRKNSQDQTTGSSSNSNSDRGESSRRSSLTSTSTRRLSARGNRISPRGVNRP